MADKKELLIKVKGDTEHARRDFASFAKELKGLDGGVAGTAKAFGALRGVVGSLGLAAVASALAEGLSAVTRAAAEAEAVDGRLNAVLRATGGIAGVTAAEIDALADSLARTTQFDDEALKSAMTTLLTFPGVNRQVFGDAIRLAADLSVVMNQDLATSARHVGKALQDPVEGLRFLKQELGVNTDALSRQNQELIKNGDLLGAQQNVLKELETRLGGAAAGANAGLAGATAGVTKSWNELLETIGRTPEISAGAQRSLTSLAGVLNLLNESLKDRNQDFLRKYNLVPPRRLTEPKPLGPIDTAGLPKTRILTDAEIALRDKETETLKKQAEALKAQVDPLHVYQKALADIDKLKRAGLITDEQWASAQLVAADAYDKATEQLDEQGRALDRAAEQLRQVIDPARAIQQEMATLDALLQRNKITWEEWADGQLIAQQKLGEVGDKTRATLDEMTEFNKAAAQGMQRAFADEFFNILQGNFDDLGESFTRLLQRMAAELAASQIMELLLGNFGKTGQVGGFIGSLFHDGGTVGASGGVTRAVSPLLFAGAPRYHGGGIAGLSPDEVPAILQRGEMVIPRDALGGGGVPPIKVQVENKGTPIVAEQADARFEADGLVVRVITADLQRGGPIANATARTFGLRRSGV